MGKVLMMILPIFESQEKKTVEIQLNLTITSGVMPLQLRLKFVFI